jgi:uncharacterized protein (DUF427 family)
MTEPATTAKPARAVLEPGPDHPITITPATSRVLVRAGDAVVADTMRALTMQEAHLPPVHYVPVADVSPGLLRPSSTTTYCPYKGDCSYYAIATPAGEIADAAWTYERPYPAVAAIAGHVAFYAGKVEILT